jgi:uncharacterized membrane protein
MNAALTNPVIANGWQMHGDASGWWMGGMVIWMVLFWAALTLGIVWLVQAGLDRRPQPGQGPGEILDRRFAEGAITFDEYHEQKVALLGEQTDRQDGASAHQMAGGREG